MLDGEGSDSTILKSITVANRVLQLQFEEKCFEAGESDSYFLLSAFANMASVRTLGAAAGRIVKT